MEGNPFTGAYSNARASTAGSVTVAGNPFDPFSTPAPSVQHQSPQAGQPHGYINGGAPKNDSSSYGMAASSSSSGYPQPQAQNPFGQPTQEQVSIYGQPPVIPQGQQRAAFPSGSGFLLMQGGLTPANNSMVVSEHQTYTYLLPQTSAQPPQQNPFSGGFLVPGQQPASHWGVVAPVGTGTFDPFAAPLQPYPQPASPAPMATYSSQELVPHPTTSLPQSSNVAPPATLGTPPPKTPPSIREPQQQLDRYDPSTAPAPVPHNHGTVNRHDLEQNYHDGDTETPRHIEMERDRQQAEIGRELQRTAAVPGASPLPKPELVRKKGHILSRISFRTIVMKKWKQAYWVQYGPHTMLWFRSQTDFNDWLNNPYHNQAQRNFLIKLAVNFVHDLYKPSVRGYQVTQCRTKAYGSKMVRQFKLERWMDYGPTIAAAFGSYNPKEVDDLRQAIVECMRNTPLNNGIRATGAVRQAASRSDDEVDVQQHSPYGQEEKHQTPQPVDHREQRQYAVAGGAEQPGATDIEKEGKDSDLLDLENWDDVSQQEHSVVPYVLDQSVQMYGPPQPPQERRNVYGAPPLPGVYGAPPLQHGQEQNPFFQQQQTF